jgi:glycosyltransferase involved in cell wall biosynthesis
MSHNPSSGPFTVDIFFYAYNQRDFVRHGIESILAQQFPVGTSVRLLCIDDGSSDGTHDEMVETLTKAQQNSDRDLSQWSIEVRNRPKGGNLGQTRTYQEGLRWTSADFFTVLEGDDYWCDSRHVQNLIDQLVRYPYTTAAFSSWISLTEHGQIMEVRRPHFPGLAARLIDTSSLLANNPPGTLSACVYRGSVLARIVPSLLSLDNLADWGTNLIASQFGPMIWSRKVSLVYTHVAQSLWRQQNRRTQVAQMAELLDDYSTFVPEKLQQLFVAERQRLSEEYSSRTRIRRAIRHPIVTARSLVGKVLRSLRLIPKR